MRGAAYAQGGNCRVLCVRARCGGQSVPAAIAPPPGSVAAGCPRANRV